MIRARRVRNGGFSLLELVIVVVIIGIIAAIAVPRMSRGSAGASDSALTGDLAVLRNGIDLFSTEHNGAFPTATDITNQLVQYTDANCQVSATKDATHIYGPYIRQIPTLPVGNRKGGAETIGTADAAGVGWIYNATTGAINANTTTEADAAGKLYSSY